MLNSSNNNSKFKNLDDLKAKMANKSSGGFGGGGFGGSKSSSGGFGGGGFGGSKGGFGGGGGVKLKKQEQIIIEEEESNDPGKLFDFDMNQVDKSLLPPKDYTKPAMVVVFTIVCVVFGAFIGWCWQGVLADRESVNTRIEVAKVVDGKVRPKIEHFQEFTQRFKQRSESMGAGVLEYNHDFYNDVIKKYKEADFILDISSDLPPNTISMASNSEQNPLSDLRGYAAGTTLLGAILDSHIRQTEADMDEIKTLLGKSSATDRNIVYALKLNAADLINITTPNSDRLLKAVACTEVYQAKRAITDDEEADKVFKSLIENGTVPSSQVKDRTYNASKAPKKKKGEVEITTDPNLTLPSRLMYVLEDHSGATEIVFADEVLLVERNKLVAGSANALDRYKRRMMQILSVLGEIEKSTDGLQSRIHIIATEDPI